MKRCNGCLLDKPASEYHKKGGSDLLRHLCKPCYRLDANARRPKKGRFRRSPEAEKAGRKIILRRHRQTEGYKAKHSARQAARRALKLQATPSWLTADQKKWIDTIYAFAAMMNARVEEPGQKVHVDHIIPLNGKTVRGLHVPWNLQIMEASANSSKGNKF